MKGRNRKRLLLAGVLAVSLLLSGCYVPPDDISNNTQVLPQESVLPFATLVPTPTPTPVPVVTPTEAPSGTPEPAVTPTPTWAPATTKPVTTVAVITQEPVATTQAPTSLKNGSKGSDVRRLQQRLKDLGYYAGSVDGHFGDGTEAAVRAFQAANGLGVDGKAGAQTTAKLYSSSAKRAASAATAKPGVTATPRPTATGRTNIYLEVGTRGNEVTKLQQRLISLGWLSGKADGSYGGATQAAVKAFQNRKGLWADGKAGPDTLTALYSDNAPRTSDSTAAIGLSLKLGNEGEEVRALQRRLKNLGYYRGSVDGQYGASTEQAVRLFQAAIGLTADGVAGTATLNGLFVDTAPRNTGAAAGSVDVNTSQVASTGYVTLESGSTGDAVRTLQSALKKAGFYAGSVDGTYGVGTVSAVIAFQMASGLEADGKAGPATQRALYTTGSSISYSTLRPGMSGTAVTNLQYTLYELGYYHSTIDGSYGDATTEAVKAFQKRNKISPVDGVAGNTTLQKLYSSSAKSAATETTRYNKLQLGDTGEDVLEMKDVLIQLGYPATGDTNTFDEATRQAVMLFQQRNGLSVDGIAGPDTQACLYGSNPVPNR